MVVGRDLTNCDGKLAGNEAHVWHFSVDLPDGMYDALFERLDDEEKERALRFKFPASRNLYVASHAFLRKVLGRYLGADPGTLRFRAATLGKPELTAGDLRFNLSHTDGAAVVAVTRRSAVGVDVERVRENLDPLELAERFFSRPEIEWLRSQPESQRFSAFFACWTAKEAYVKASGGGMSIPLAGFGVIPYRGQAELRLEVYGDPVESARWSMWQVELEAGLPCALAVEGENLTVRVGRLPELDV